MAGRLAAIGSTPLIEGFPSAPYVLIYGRPGDRYAIDKTTGLSNGGTWSEINTHDQNDLGQAVLLATHLGADRGPTVFLRVR